MKKFITATLQIVAALSLTSGIAFAMQPSAESPGIPVHSETVQIPAEKVAEAPAVAETAPKQEAAPIAAPAPEPAPAPSEMPKTGNYWVDNPTVTGSMGDWELASGIPQADWASMEAVIAQESHWKPDAVNSIGCIGLGQSCPGGTDLAGSCPNWKLDPVCQLKFFDAYAHSRYGGWAQARTAWIAQGWW